MEIVSGTVPEAGLYYTLEDCVKGTSAQRKSREALITEYWRSGLHPKYGGDPRDILRDQLKKSIGEGFERFFYGYYTSERMIKGNCKEWEEIPEECRALYKEDMAFIVGKLKSFSHYSKKQMSMFIDNLIDEMKSAGVCSKKFDEILKGMEDK
jgi:hypothetical protein